MALDRRKVQLVNFCVLVVLLAAIIVGLGALIYLAGNAVGQVDDTRVQQVLARLAWLSLALMGVALVLLLLAVMQFVRTRMPRTTRGPTPYVDAWALAGKRLKLDDGETPREQEESGPGET